MVRVADDAIYARPSLHTIPHRLRIRQVIFELRKLRLENFSYADVGCGGGSITHRIVEAIRPSKAFAFDANGELIQAASELFSDISFRVWNLTSRASFGETFDLVTCLETLEHIENLSAALNNLLAMTAGVLFISVPIELGLLGAAKFAAKLVLGRKPLGNEHAGSPRAYLRTVLSGGDVSRFRVRSDVGHWASHTGFDYRKIDAFLLSRRAKFVATNRGWNRFYCIAARTHGGD